MANPNAQGIVRRDLVRGQLPMMSSAPPSDEGADPIDQLVDEQIQAAANGVEPEDDELEEVNDGFNEDDDDHESIDEQEEDEVEPVVKPAEVVSQPAPRRRGRPTAAQSASESVERAAPKPRRSRAQVLLDELPEASQSVGQSAITSLYSWMSGFDFAAGVVWAKLVRTHPAEVIRGNERFLTAGPQEDHVLAPMEERTILEKWGGSAWVVEIWAFDAKGGKERRIDFRPVSVSGDPIAYVLGGRRRVIPQTLTEEEEDEMEETHARRDPRSFGFGRPNGRVGFGVAPGQEPQALVSLAQSAIAQQKRNADDVNMMKLVTETSQRAADSIERNTKAQIDDMKRSTEAALANAGRPAELMAETAKQQFQAQLQASTESLKAEKELRRIEIEAVRNDHARQLEAMRADHQRNQTTLQTTFDMQLRNASESVTRAEHRAETAETRARDELKTERESVRREIDRERVDRERDLTRQKEIYDGQAAQMKLLYEGQVQNATHEVERLRLEVTSLRTENVALREKANPDAKTQMEHVRSIMELSKTISGGDDDDDEDADPLAGAPNWMKLGAAFAKSDMASAFAKRIEKAGAAAAQAPVPPSIPGGIAGVPAPRVAALPEAPMVPVMAPPAALPPGHVAVGGPAPVAAQASSQVNPAPHAPVVAATAEDAERAETVQRIAQGLQEAVPSLESAMLAGMTGAQVADQALSNVDRESLEDLVEAGVDVVIEALELVAPDSSLCTAAGTKFIHAMFRRLERVLAQAEGA